METNCCTSYMDENLTGCLICSADIEYNEKSRDYTCAVCGKTYSANACCENGHYVCDECHSYGAFSNVVSALRDNTEKDPIAMFEEISKMPQVHMHGPEHHAITPLVMLTAYRNCGGFIDYTESVKEICKRARQLPGGTCGFWGVCGSAAGAGIYASVLMKSSPLNEAVWPYPQKLVMDILARLVEHGGPRCCKRTSRLAIETAARFTEEMTGISMPFAKIVCADISRNRECIFWRCPYHPEFDEI